MSQRKYRPPHEPFPPEALKVFARMLALEQRCTCAPIDDEEYWLHESCAACEQWGKQHGVLRTILRLRPWNPAVENPHAEVRPNWQPNPEAQARYLAMLKAIKDASVKSQ